MIVINDRANCESFKRASKKLYSLHQIGLLDTLELLGRMGMKPITTIIGIEPKDVEVGMELSSEIEDAMPGIISQVLDEVSL